MIHPGLIPPPAAREGHKPKCANCPPSPTGILAVQGSAVPGKCPLAPPDSVQGLCLERGRGGPLHQPTQTLLTSMVAETPPVLQSPKLLGPRPLGQQSAACPCASPTMASSGSSSTSSGTFALGPCGRITSQGICGWPGQGLSANVLTPLPPENGWDPSARPGVPRRQVCPNSEGLASFVHLAPLAHTWLLRSLFWEDSVVSGGVLRGAGAGVRELLFSQRHRPIIFTQRLTENSQSKHEDKFLVILLCSCLSCVQLFCDPMDCSPLGSSVHGIIPARILEWVAISYSRRSS